MNRRRFSLQVRLVLVLLVISLIPLAVSAVLIRQMAEVAQNFASNNAARLRPPLERAEASFGRLIEAKKELFGEVTLRIAGDSALSPIEIADDGEANGDPRAEPERFETLLASKLKTSGDLLGLELLDEGAVIASVTRPSPQRASLSRYREVFVEKPVGKTNRVLRARFAADLTITEDLKAVRSAIKLSERIDAVRESLPSGYVGAFLALVGGVVIMVTVFGIVVARRLSRRIEALLEATRRLAGGDLETRAEIYGRDELAEVGRSFNKMVTDLRSDRAQILYLQRIGAWQDVARRLAHEIKNPLTPIQLAMQQVVSAYDGDDERFRKLLTDADEIVGEEIQSLRRLVDAFSALGRLPRPDAKPLDIAVVLDDLMNDPVFADHLVVSKPPAPVMVGGDRLLLRRLLANLVENGIQAGEAEGDGKVEVSWSADSATGLATILVDDSGPGIDADDAERLFEPYVTSKETGTGLGLAIGKKIAIEHRGALEIDCEPSPLGGARFRLTIPLVD